MGIRKIVSKIGRGVYQMERGRRKFFENMDRINQREDIPYDFDEPMAKKKRLLERDKK